jgi:hypothetical protein
MAKRNNTPATPALTPAAALAVMQHLATPQGAGNMPAPRVVSGQGATPLTQVATPVATLAALPQPATPQAGATPNSSATPWGGSWGTTQSQVWGWLAAHASSQPVRFANTPASGTTACLCGKGCLAGQCPLLLATTNWAPVPNLPGWQCCCQACNPGARVIGTINGGAARRNCTVTSTLPNPTTWGWLRHTGGRGATVQVVVPNPQLLGGRPVVYVNGKPTGIVAKAKS